MADEHAPLKSETAPGKMADAARRATARHREVDALQKMRDEMARPLSAAAELQEQIDRMLGPTRELERTIKGERETQSELARKARRLRQGR